MRICIAFFGLNRSLPWTQRSIKSNLIQPLRSYGATVTLYGHFNVPKEIKNPRSGENFGAFKNQGAHLLPFNQVILEPQENTETDSLLEKFKSHDLQSNDTTGHSHRNLINQYRSLRAVMQLIEQSEGNEIDAILFARPDIEYLDKLIPENVIPGIISGQYDLLTPTWHQWGGLNDRVCLCNLTAAKIYANRLSILNEIIEAKVPMNAESILLHATKKNNLKNGELPIRGARVRVGGYTVDEGFDLSKMTQLRFFKRRVVNKLRQIAGI